MNNWNEYFQSDDFKNLAIALAIFLLFILLRKFFTKYVFKILLKLIQKAPTEILTQIFLAYERPMQWLFTLIGTYIAVGYFPYLDQNNGLFLNVIKAFIIILISWGLYNLTSSTSILFEGIHRKTKFDLDDILFPFISKTLRFIIVAITITVILEVFDYSIGGFITGLGLGGLAFALAAQDALSNLFGGFVILTERPFTIGHWISTPSVEGTVEDITFRSTKVRTFSQGLVTVPNSTLANEPITNLSKMGKRRVSMSIRLTYDTPTERIKSVTEQINHLLKSHKGIHQDAVYVKFDEYKEDGIDLLIYYFTKSTAYGEHLDVKEEVNFKVMNILEEEGVSIAIPSRRLYMDQTDQTIE